MSRKTTSILAAAALAALLSGAAYSQERFGKDTLLGDPIPADGPVDKVVKVDANTRWVNVVQNENVKFIVGSQTFAWHFQSPRAAVNLKDIAPAGAIDRNLYVYLTPDTLYGSTND
jgi:hypothetical protein